MHIYIYSEFHKAFARLGSIDRFRGKSRRCVFIVCVRKKCTFVFVVSAAGVVISSRYCSRDIFALKTIAWPVFRLKKSWMSLASSAVNDVPNMTKVRVKNVCESFFFLYSGCIRVVKVVWYYGKWLPHEEYEMETRTGLSNEGLSYHRAHSSRKKRSSHRSLPRRGRNYMGNNGKRWVILSSNRNIPQSAVCGQKHRVLKSVSLYPDDPHFSKFLGNSRVLYVVS